MMARAAMTCRDLARAEAITPAMIDAAIERAHALRAEAMRRLLRNALGLLLAPVRWLATGLPWRRHGRLAAREPARIEDSVLADIGVNRAEIDETVGALLERGGCGSALPRYGGGRATRIAV